MNEKKQLNKEELVKNYKEKDEKEMLNIISKEAKELSTEDLEKVSGGNLNLDFDQTALADLKVILANNS